MRALARRLCLVSWNIHGCMGSDRRFDLSRVASVLRELGGEVAALQEVGEVRGHMPLVDQARALAEQTAMHHAFMATVARGRRRFGNAILSRFPIRFERGYDLSVGGREARGCLRADLELDDGIQLHVFNLHFGLGFRERRRQAMLLASDILRDAALAFPLVVAGDFNRVHPGPTRILLRRELQDVAVKLQRVEPTYPARLPLLRLDRILVGGGVRPLQIRVVDRKEARQASDHLPLRAILEVGPPPGARDSTQAP